ncbi:DNA-binding protein [Bacteroidia bacterium]|nr:DNA-binding protein [Bacteroidia bacterium]
MYINNEDFEKWMERLSKKLNEIGKDLKALVNTNEVLDKDEKMLDNQDLAFMLKCSFRTLQRYRSNGVLPYAKFGHKIYYRVSDIRAFVKEYCDFQTYQRFEKNNPPEESNKAD